MEWIVRHRPAGCEACARESVLYHAQTALAAVYCRHDRAGQVAWGCSSRTNSMQWLSEHPQPIDKTGSFWRMLDCR